jgi:uncharacterized protein YndB with AHSA1/START domain
MDRNGYVPSPLAEARAMPASAATSGAGWADDAAGGAGDGPWTLVFVRYLNHRPAQVWAALTEPDQLREWAPFNADRSLASIGRATLTVVDGETEVRLDGAVRRAEEPTLLEYVWGDELLRWELSPTDTGTQLTLHHTTARRSGVPMMAAGWHLCLDVMAHLLDGEPIGPIRGRDALEFGWQRLHDAYADRLGIAVPPAQG